MADRLAAAKAKLAAGRQNEAVAELEAAVAEGPQPAAVWRMLAGQLFRLGRYDAAETRAAEGLAAYPDDYDLANTRGIALRRLNRLEAASAALEAAAAMRPQAAAAWRNLGNVAMDLGDGAQAEAAFQEVIRCEPEVTAHRWWLGRALMLQDRREAAADAMRAALVLDPDYVEAALDLAALLRGEQRLDEALGVLEDAIRRMPTEQRLLEAKSTQLRRSGQAIQAAAFLDAVETLLPRTAWIPHHRGLLLADTDRAAANAELERAHARQPDNLDYTAALIEGLARDRSATEATSLERAYRLALELLPKNTNPANKVLSDTLARVCDFDAVAAVGSFRDMGRGLAASGRHSGLLEQIPRVEDDAMRLELLEQHRIWGRDTEAWAARAPIRRPPPRPAGGKLRLGLLSSDLREHVVGRFALPLFEHPDPRFELFVYSFYPGRDDPVQAKVRATSTFRSLRGLSTHDAAQAIADDGLDLLIELGGSTQHNRIEVMAFRPAPRLASWLGYPHSVGLSCIDWLICDPQNAPERPELILESPLKLPRSWITLGRHAFTDAAAVAEDLPSDRNGFVTFGTANNPYKYNRPTLAAWARVVAATPGSRFMFVRPEGGVAGFRSNIERAFAAEGVGPERLVWRAVRGAHLPHYNDMDVSLDTFPLTGGTTTTESLWMGVPVVSLVGPAFYERLSYSILTSADLADLCVRDLDRYKAVAVELAGDVERRRELRRSLRTTLRTGILGRTGDWARDFYTSVWTAVRG